MSASRLPSLTAVGLALALLPLFAVTAAAYIDQNPYSISLSAPTSVATCTGQVTIAATIRGTDNGQPVPFTRVTWLILQSPSASDALGRAETITNDSGQTSVNLTLSPPAGQRTIRAWVSSPDWFADVVLTCGSAATAQPSTPPTATPTSRPNSQPTATPTGPPAAQPTTAPQSTGTPVATLTEPPATDAPPTAQPTATSAAPATAEPTDSGPPATPESTPVPTETPVAGSIAEPGSGPGGLPEPSLPEQTGSTQIVIGTLGLLIGLGGLLLLATVRLRRRRPWALPPR